MSGIFILCAFIALFGWIYLAFFHGAFWQLLLDEPSPKPSAWPSVDIIVPARNEADALPRSLSSLLTQDYPGAWRVILVDDHSDDGTGALAKKIAAEHSKTDHLTIINAPTLVEGWSGKLAALQAGVTQSTSDYLLFTDADIAHPTDSLQRLTARAVEKNLDLVSRMVKLHCQSFAEKLLIPAFVFFFSMLYPFHRSNDADSSVAAGAGGVMFVKRAALNNIGGLTRVKHALIDDCSLAKALKEHGGAHETAGRTELTLVRDIQSLRLYPNLRDIWGMISRTAFTQLKYSLLMLVGTVIGMLLLFVAPIVLLLTGRPMIAEIGLAAWIVMSIMYMPMIGFYDLPLVWALSLPIAALVYIGATIDSARLYWQGKGGQWKGRSQA